MSKYRVFIPMMYHRVVVIDAPSAKYARMEAMNAWDDPDLHHEDTEHTQLATLPMVAWRVGEGDADVDEESDDDYNRRVDESFDKYQDERNEKK